MLRCNKIIEVGAGGNKAVVDRFMELTTAISQGFGLNMTPEKGWETRFSRTLVYYNLDYEVSLCVEDHFSWSEHILNVRVDRHSKYAQVEAWVDKFFPGKPMEPYLQRAQAEEYRQFTTLSIIAKAASRGEEVREEVIQAFQAFFRSPEEVVRHQALSDLGRLRPYWSALMPDLQTLSKEDPSESLRSNIEQELEFWQKQIENSRLVANRRETLKKQYPDREFDW